MSARQDQGEPSPTRHEPRDLRLFAGGLFLLGLGRECDRLLTNLKLHELGLTESAIGRVVASHQLGTWLAALPTAFFLSRMPLRHLLCVAAACVSIGLFLIGITRTEWLAHPGEFLLGTGLSIPFVAALPLAFERAAENKRTFWIAVTPATYALAGIVASPLAGHASSWMDGRLVYVCAAALALGSTFLFARVRNLEPVAFEKRRRRRLHGTRRLLLVNTATGLATGLSVPFFNLFLKGQAGLSQVAIGFVFAAGHGFGVLMFFLAPRFEKHFGARRGAFLSELLVAVLVASLIPFNHAAALAAAVALRAGAMALTYPLFKKTLLDQAQKEDRHLIAGVSSFLWNLTLVAGSLLGGIVLHATSFDLLLGIAAALYAFAAFLLLPVGSRHAGT